VHLLRCTPFSFSFRGSHLLSIDNDGGRRSRRDCYQWQRQAHRRDAVTNVQEIHLTARHISRIAARKGRDWQLPDDVAGKKNATQAVFLLTFHPISI
jgi:hypothetical protein